MRSRCIPDREQEGKDTVFFDFGAQFLNRWYSSSLVCFPSAIYSCQGDLAICFTSSPRMPHTLGEIFAHAQLLNFKNRNSWAGPGAASVLVDQHVRMQRAETQSQQPALLQTAAETTAGGSTHWQLAKKTWKLIVEFVTTKRLVCKNGHSLVEPPSRVFYTVSVSACLFVGERFFQKVYGRPLPSTSPFTLFAR